MASEEKYKFDDDGPHKLANRGKIEPVQHLSLVKLQTVMSFAHTIAPLSKAANARLYEIEPLDDDLESVFKYLVGQ